MRRMLRFLVVNAGVALLFNGCGPRPPVIEATPNGAVLRSARLGLYTKAVLTKKEPTPSSLMTARSVGSRRTGFGTHLCTPSCTAIGSSAATLAPSRHSLTPRRKIRTPTLFDVFRGDPPTCTLISPVRMAPRDGGRDESACHSFHCCSLDFAVGRSRHSANGPRLDITTQDEPLP